MTSKDQDQPKSSVKEAPTKTILSGHFSVDLKEPENRQTKSEKKKQTFRERSYREIKKLRFWLEVAALIIGGCYTHYAHQQVSEAHEANRLTKIAQGQTEETISNTNRPWLGVSGSLLTDLAVGHKPIVTITIKNYGQSPTEFRGKLVTATGAANEIDEGVRAVQSAEPKTYSEAVVFPNQDYLLIEPLKDPIVSDMEMNQIQKGSIVILVGVVLTYKDRIGRSHYTRWAGTYNVSKNSFDIASTGNQAD